MDKLIVVLNKLKELGCCGVKLSFEDEGALFNEAVTMRKLTAQVDLGLSIKIGGCEAKRDIVDCIDLDCDTIVAPMIESEFALRKFLKSLDFYKCDKKKGFNLETISAYHNLEELSSLFNNIDFVTVGRNDFVSSMNKNINFVDSEEIYEKVKKIFTVARKKNILCNVGGALTMNSKEFIEKLIHDGLLDKFETRYIVYDVKRIDFNNFEKLLYLGFVFEVEWLKYISSRYLFYGNKDLARIKITEERIAMNKN